MDKKKPLPTMEELTAFLNSQSSGCSKRDVARAFGIKGENRVYLKQLLKQIENEGDVVRRRGKFVSRHALPSSCVVEITGTDADGELVGRPIKWKEDGKIPQILITKTKVKPAIGIGDVVQVNLTPVSSFLYEGEAVRRVSLEKNQMVGVFFDGKIMSVDRRFKEAFSLDDSFPPDLKPEDLVLVEIPPIRQRYPKAHFIQKIGRSTDANAASLISIFAHHLPVSFSDKAIKIAKDAKLPPISNRVDLRDLNFVTIDGADARDFDDAVFVKKEEKGWLVYVAIADVAWFVRTGTALDNDAFLRGNSTYFPDRVLPMLPTELSNGLCSLNPKEDRPAMVCEIHLSHDGHIQKSQFMRAMIKSKARLTYDEVQADFDDKKKISGLGTLMDDLKTVYGILATARKRRGVLDLDVPERQVVLTPTGKVKEISLRQRFESHQMIEELMILANVAAAVTLEKNNAPTMYRVHDKPSAEKIENLRVFLKSQGKGKLPSSSPTPSDFNQLLSGKSASLALNEMVLRTQSQAEYSPENIGHYGLALEKYAHFTSPIRRYADVLVHRALITTLKLGEGGLSEDEAKGFDKIAEHISATERQSAAAEQDAMDRYVASYMADKIGQRFRVRVSSVTPFGLFVCLDEYGADGLIPIRTLGSDYFVFDEKCSEIYASGGKERFFIGQEIDVVLKESVPLTGGLIFGLINPVVRKKIVKNKKRRR